jgi:3-oxoacyl-[acyl-carrier protein] reductase
MMSPTPKPIANKVAVVTGGSRGIGAAICERLATAGAHVIFTYSQSVEAANRVVEACQKDGGKATAANVDSGDVAAGQQLVEQITAKFDHIDILVNNAASLLPGDLFSVTPEMLDRYIAVNIRGPFLFTQAVAQHMRAGGRIINIGSGFGEVVPAPGLDLYAMAKFALAGLTRAWAHDLAPRKITVNCIQPGPVHTDMNPEDGPLSGFLTPRTAIKRYGRVEEIAEMVAYLVGPYTDNVTGAMLNNDGGITA